MRSPNAPHLWIVEEQARQLESPGEGPAPCERQETCRTAQAIGRGLEVIADQAHDPPTVAAEAPREHRFAYLAIAAHFPGVAREHTVAAHRLFPGHMRADIQPVVERLFGPRAERFVGILEHYRYETLTFAALMRDGQHAHMMAPLQYEDVDVGEAEPVRCLENGLWLCRSNDMPYAVFLSRHREFNHEAGLRIEIAVPAGEAGNAITRAAFAEFERAVGQARCYRGKVLSLERHAHYDGMASGIKVHRLPPVGPDEVILPDATRALLERNVLSFVGARDALRGLGLQTKKGVLLYGPPGHRKDPHHPLSG